MADFGVLRAGRRRLHEFCSLHQISLEFFRSGDSFKLHEKEPNLGAGLSHMTSTATCLESLADYPNIALADRLQWFAENALKRKDWLSEGSAGIYCRCRTLPLVIDQAPPFTQIEPHLGTILRQLAKKDRFAIGEADPDLPEEQWYPPNAFHTFWTLEALRRCQRYSTTPEFNKFSEHHNLDIRNNTMMLWAWQLLGCQIALHKANSAALDTDQLIWALAIVTRFDAAGTIATSPQRYRDLVQQGIDTFFLAQDPSGTWVHHGPLFHYKNAGNAYCYIFESLTPLLKNALQPDATLLRALLRPHADRLFKLLEYVQATRISLGSGRAIGWSSGHRTNMPYAESWATAAVFACMQAVRRLIGIWSKEDALRELEHRAPTQSQQDAISTLVRRGNTWSSPTVAEQLITLFVNPARMAASPHTIDPDDCPIADRQARSAILFGPAGTSKTTLTRTVAEAIGWEYVELHPSHFVAAGLPNVQRTADEIFTRLMELDRCVVLFDEIDELMRERDIEPDAFGRFLTTSMLPKLAELWNQKRVIYFVATNHIELFDRALTRSQRFDALIFVPPPAFEAKGQRLLEILSALAPGVAFEIKFSAIEIEIGLASLSKPSGKPEDVVPELNDDQLLCKLMLLRYDQLDELAHILLQQLRPSLTVSKVSIDATALKAALKLVADSRLKEVRPYIDLMNDQTRVVRDYGKDVVWRLADGNPPLKELEQFKRESNKSIWYVGTRELLTAVVVAPHVVTFKPDGELLTKV